MKLFIIMTLLFQSSLFAKSIPLSFLTFNIMCEYCHKDEQDQFKKRKNKIKEIIENYPADVIALQEVIFKSNVEYFFSELKKYEVFFYQNSLFSYPDAVLAINKNKFKIINKEHFWLGKNNGDFSFGWKPSLPRIALIIDTIHIESGVKMTFITAHFDNLKENLDQSAHFINKLTKKRENVFFLADTNSKLNSQSYQTLSDVFNDLALPLEKNPDYCYLHKGSKYPTCRVDHIFFNNLNFKTKTYQIIIDKINERFPSDHRPIYLEGEITF